MIHVVFVPYIFWGIMLILNFAPIIVESKTLESVHLPTHPGFFGLLFYLGYYLYLGDYSVAVPYDCILIALTIHANAFFKACSTNEALVHFLLSQIIGWGLQVVVGHNIVEKRKPALLDSLWDSVVMAPLFTFYEVLFWCGLKQDLHRDLMKQVCENIAVLNEGKPLRKSGSSKSQ